MRRIIGCALALFLLLFGAAPALAAPLDEIQSITIDAATSADGVVTLQYDIVWKVLDSTSEGPLSWVQIGVPNDAYEITGFGGDAASAVPYNQNGESKVRIDLSREFNAGETAAFQFTIRQYNLMQKTENEYCCEFVPGWFDGIAVKQMTVRWQSANVTHANKTLDGVYTWSGSLAAGEHFQTVTTYYSSSMVPASPPMPVKYDDNPPVNYDDGTYSNTTDDHSGNGLAGIFIFILVIPVIIVASIIRAARGYRGGRGFTGRSGFWGGGFHGGGGGGCACACAGCACACACAGGGRAGCARKDFTGFDGGQEEKGKENQR